ncbi:MAG: insulinase family protein [Spirochaetaceae bacterium]|nr:insulinase family protein [Spirochaetaceae bacterium]
MPVKQEVLTNGTVLITEPIASSKIVAIGFWFFVGSRNETVAERGICHFVEHMLFKGTKTRTSYDIACGFDKIGGNVNAFTERECVCVHCVVPAQFLNDALAILIDMTENSLFDSEEIEKERAVIESEIISALDDPEEAALDAVFETLWKDRFLAQSISGSVKEIRNLTREKLFSWYKKYIASGKLLVTLSGNFSHENVINQLQTMSFRKNHPQIVSLPFNDNWQSGLHFLRGDFQQEQVFLVYPLEEKLNSRQLILLGILNALLGDTMSSRLFQRLREKGAYCYNVYSYFFTFFDYGFWCFYASSSLKNLPRLIADLTDEVDAVLKTGFTTEELESAKQHYLGEEIIFSEDMEQKMKRLARTYFSDNEQLSLEELENIVKNITLDEVFSFYKTCIKEKQKALVVYGSKIPKKMITTIKKNWSCYNE